MMRLCLSFVMAIHSWLPLQVDLYYRPSPSMGLPVVSLMAEQKVFKLDAIFAPEATQKRYMIDWWEMQFAITFFMDTIQPS